MFSWFNPTGDFTTYTPVGVLPRAWHHSRSARTVWPVVSILWLDRMASLICNLYLTVAARPVVWKDLSLRHMLLVVGTLSSQPACNTRMDMHTSLHQENTIIHEKLAQQLLFLLTFPSLGNLKLLQLLTCHWNKTIQRQTNATSYR